MLKIIENPLIGDTYEDWTMVRSHGRAARRRAKHPQRIVIRYKANGKFYHLRDHDAIVCHPGDAAKLRATLK